MDFVKVNAISKLRLSPKHFLRLLWSAWRSLCISRCYLLLIASSRSRKLVHTDHHASAKCTAAQPDCGRSGHHKLVWWIRPLSVGVVDLAPPVGVVDLVVILWKENNLCSFSKNLTNWTYNVTGVVWQLFMSWKNVDLSQLCHQSVWQHTRGCPSQAGSERCWPHQIWNHFARLSFSMLRFCLNFCELSVSILTYFLPLGHRAGQQQTFKTDWRTGFCDECWAFRVPDCQSFCLLHRRIQQRCCWNFFLRNNSMNPKNLNHWRVSASVIDLSSVCRRDSLRTEQNTHPSPFECKSQPQPVTCSIIRLPLQSKPFAATILLRVESSHICPTKSSECDHPLSDLPHADSNFTVRLPRHW